MLKTVDPRTGDLRSAGLPALPSAIGPGRTIEVVLARLDVDDEALRASQALLARDERDRASRFRFERDRRRYVVGRAVLRRLLAARLGTPADAIEFVYGPRGKPAIAPDIAHAGLRFNVSHSNDVAAYAFATGREIGIDVECFRVLPDADEIAGRWFARGECEAYRALPSTQRPVGFLNCWTRKEAFVKALGDGLSHPLDGFEVTLAPHEPARIVRFAEVPGKYSGWTLHGFTSDAGVIGAVVVQRLPARSGAWHDEVRITEFGEAASMQRCHG